MLDQDPLWYKDAIIYELHVRAFHDSIGDGMGDFRGLTQKLDYLQDLGVTTIWILPFYPSPLKDDGYDIAHYTEVHKHYGNLRDFRDFLDAAHRRNLRVITELVINHTSNQHPWFQRARRAPAGSPERDFYVWSDTPEKYKEARIIFKDFETSNWSWDPVARAYYWHRFYSHQPDLNYDNPAVWDAIFPVVDFWLGMGVDGMRLDAVPYLFERDGTICENLPETHAFLKALRKHVDAKFSQRMLLAEANQWPEDAVAYLGSGDECHMAFHFPVMPRMFMAIHMEDRYPILDIMSQTPAIPESCQWCLFIRNHDELTLEMVTDEERDYMYRVYASNVQARINLGIRRRLAPLLGNNRRRIELINGLLFSLPGTPVIYYGDEIGMGDNIYLGDRNGVRTPMQWSADRNAGFSRANPQKLFLPVIIDPEYHYEAINVEAQQNNPNSLLWWMKRLIALRKRHQAFGRGTLEFLHPANRKVLAFLRIHQNEHLLVVANLSRFVQHVELDLSKMQGMIPVELFGRNAFPPIGKQPYPITLGPHAFYWFILQTKPEPRFLDSIPNEPGHLAEALILGDWNELFHPPIKSYLEAALTKHLQRTYWASGDQRGVKASSLTEAIQLPEFPSRVCLCLIEIEYYEGPRELYLLPMTVIKEDELAQLPPDAAHSVIARMQGSNTGYLIDALVDPVFRAALLQALMTRKQFSLPSGELLTTFLESKPLSDWPMDSPPASSIVKEEQSNTSIIYEQRVILKVMRKIEEGIHPEVEVGRFLHEKMGLGCVAPVLGTLEYRHRKADPMTLAILHGYIPNEGTCWQYTLDELSHAFERILSLTPSERTPPDPHTSFFDRLQQAPPPLILQVMGSFLDWIRLLGQRTAEMHLALSHEHEDPAFISEPFTKLYQRSIYQSMRNTHRQTFQKLFAKLDQLDSAARDLAQSLIDMSEPILDRFQCLLQQKFSGQRIRHHGDFNLCEVLTTGKDFVIIDFEGDKRRSLSERRVKRSPLRDLASMICSFHYAVGSIIMGNGSPRGQAPGMIRTEDLQLLRDWGWTWFSWVSASFLDQYVASTHQAAFMPQNREEFRTLMELFLLEKSLQELGYDIENRPSWIMIPMRLISYIMTGQRS